MATKTDTLQPDAEDHAFVQHYMSYRHARETIVQIAPHGVWNLPRCLVISMAGCPPREDPVVIIDPRKGPVTDDSDELLHQRALKLGLAVDPRPYLGPLCRMDPRRHCNNLVDHSKCGCDEPDELLIGRPLSSRDLLKIVLRSLKS